MKTYYKVIALQKRAIVLGAGPVGCSAAIMLQALGYATQVYEKLDKAVGNAKSINFAISQRFLRTHYILEALRGKKIPLPQGRRMMGRAIHNNETGSIQMTLYTPNRQALLSIGRNELNQSLAQEVGDTIAFNQEIKEVEIDENDTLRSLTIETKTGEIKKITIEPDTFVVVADGANSIIRKAMLEKRKMADTTQRHPMGYREYSIPKSVIDRTPSEFQEALENFHIWPSATYKGAQFFAYALPNHDGSFNVNLIGDDGVLKQLSFEDMHDLFNQHFKDVSQLINFQEQHSNPIGHFYSRKSDGIHSGSNFLLIGDAVHPMFPFLGIGVNVGCEDVYILAEALNSLHEQGIHPTSEDGASIIRHIFEDRAQDTDCAIDASAGNSKNIGESTEEERRRVQEAQKIMTHLEAHTHHFKDAHTFFSFTTIPMREIKWRIQYQESIVRKIQKAVQNSSVEDVLTEEYMKILDQNYERVLSVSSGISNILYK